MEKEKGGLSESALDWRYLIDGLTMEGKCVNNQCRAYEQLVLFKVGMGKWEDVYEMPVLCPICNETTDKPWEPWFYNCNYRVFIYYEDIEDVTKNKGDAKGDNYHHYDLKRDCVVKKMEVSVWKLGYDEDGNF
jgi:hypothetical protein